MLFTILILMITYDQGMLRFRLVNVNGKAVVTTHVDGKSNSVVECLQILSTGTEEWEDYLQGPKKTLDLVWSNTELVYDGSVQVPDVSAANIAEGDRVTISAEGGETNAGTYTATAVLSGESAHKYQLPDVHTQEFVIKKTAAPKINFPTAESIKYGQKLSDSILTGGSKEYGEFYWEDGKQLPGTGKSEYAVKFVPSELTEQNYEAIDTLSSDVAVNVDKATPAVTVSVEINSADNSNEVTFTASLSPCGYGDLPTGRVTFSIKGAESDVIDEITNITVESGKASAVWSGAERKKYTVTAAYSGDENYTAVISDAVAFDMKKQSQDELIMLPIESKIYGDEDFLLKAEGGSGDGEITFESSDPEIISISNNVDSIRKAGNVTITATKAGNEIYNDIKASVSVDVNKKQLVVTADNKLNVNKGDEMPEFTYTVEGLVNGDSFTDPVITSSVDNTNTVGNYDIIIKGGHLTNEDSYVITYINGRLSVEDKSFPPNPPKPPRPPRPSPDDDDDDDDYDDKHSEDDIAVNVPVQIPENTNTLKPMEVHDYVPVPQAYTEPVNQAAGKENSVSDTVLENSESSKTEEVSESEASSEEADTLEKTESQESSASEEEKEAAAFAEENKQENKGIGVAVIIAVLTAAAAAICAVLLFRKWKESKK